VELDITQNHSEQESITKRDGDEMAVATFVQGSTAFAAGARVLLAVVTAVDREGALRAVAHFAAPCSLVVRGYG